MDGGGYCSHGRAQGHGGSYCDACSRENAYRLQAETDASTIRQYERDLKYGEDAYVRLEELFLEVRRTADRAGKDVEAYNLVVQRSLKDMWDAISTIEKRLDVIEGGKK